MLVLKKNLRPEFKKAIGTLYPSLDDAEDFLASQEPDTLLVSVGDVTTRNLQEQGLIPHLGIIDQQVERKPAPQDIVYDNVTLKADNPAGTVTRELWDAVEQGFQLIKAGYRVLILVKGEEDLAVVPAVILAPPGSLVLYGQPGEGVVICEVDRLRDKVIKMKEMLMEE
ncbi:MAG TPA: DUF359 domain-containing protein [Methanobacteriaceae archaeon]|nr:DUF359 domain-containing protein [Methanobacteriaceae archaeon]